MWTKTLHEGRMDIVFIGGVCGWAVDTSNSRSGCRGFKPHPLHCFLRQGTLLHFVVLHPGVQMAWVPVTYCWGITLHWTSIPSRGGGGVAIFLGILHSKETRIRSRLVGPLACVGLCLFYNLFIFHSSSKRTKNDLRAYIILLQVLHISLYLYFKYFPLFFLLIHVHVPSIDFALIMCQSEPVRILGFFQHIEHCISTVWLTSFPGSLTFWLLCTRSVRPHVI